MKLRTLVAMGIAAGLIFAGPVSSVSAANKTHAAKSSANKTKSVRSKTAKTASAKATKRVSVKKAKRMERAKAVAAASAAADEGLPALDHDGNPMLASASVLVVDQSSGEVLLERTRDR